MYGRAQIYAEYRDAIMHLYREDPQRFLSPTEARTRLQGDASLVQRWAGAARRGVLGARRSGPSFPAPQRPMQRAAAGWLLPQLLLSFSKHTAVCTAVPAPHLET